MSNSSGATAVATTQQEFNNSPAIAPVQFTVIGRISQLVLPTGRTLIARRARDGQMVFTANTKAEAQYLQTIADSSSHPVYAYEAVPVREEDEEVMAMLQTASPEVLLAAARMHYAAQESAKVFADRDVSTTKMVTSATVVGGTSGVLSAPQPV